MNWNDRYERSLQYEETRSRNLRHYQPTPRRPPLLDIAQEPPRPPPPDRSEGVGDRTLQQRRSAYGVTEETEAAAGVLHGETCGAPHAVDGACRHEGSSLSSGRVDQLLGVTVSFDPGSGLICSDDARAGFPEVRQGRREAALRVLGIAPEQLLEEPPLLGSLDREVGEEQ